MCALDLQFWSVTIIIVLNVFESTLLVKVTMFIPADCGFMVIVVERDQLSLSNDIPATRKLEQWIFRCGGAACPA